MNKKQAEQEILSRLEIFYKNAGNPKHWAKEALLRYKLGSISKQELIKMITLDEDGNLLSYKDSYGYIENGLSREAGVPFEDGEEFIKYQQALNQATEIVNCYDNRS